MVGETNENQEAEQPQEETLQDVLHKELPEQELQDDESLAEQLEEINQLSAIDYVKKYGGYAAAAAAVGVAALYLYKRGYKSITNPAGETVVISQDSRTTPGIIALVTLPKDGEMTALDKLAISLPITSGVAKWLQKKGRTASLFAMQHDTDRGFQEAVPTAHPLREDQKHIDKYVQGSKTVAKWLLDHVRSQKTEL
jgi:hypothetical protein